MKNIFLSVSCILLAAIEASGFSISNDIGYLERKWRTGAVDASTGLDAAGISAEWKKIADSDESSWQTKKARMFALGCDRTAIGVSHHDWFPAVSPWSFHRGHPMKAIMRTRAAEVDRLRSPSLPKKIAAGTKDGSWVVWKDYSHCAPDWDDIIALGFPGMRARLVDNWKDTEYYRARIIAADAMLRFVGRLERYASERAAKSDDRRLKSQAQSLKRLSAGKPLTAYDVLMFIYLEWVMGENFDYFQVRTLSNLDRILTPFYRADIAAGRTTEEEFRDQIAHFWWQWGSIDNYYGQPVYLGGTKADGTTEYSEVSRIILEVHDALALPTPKVHVKTGPSTPDWVWNKTLDLARRQRSVTFCGEEALARVITGLGYSAEQARTCAIWGCYEWGILDSCNDTIPSYISAIKPIEKLLQRAAAGKFDAKDFATFREEYFRLLEKTSRDARLYSFETERWVHEVNPSMLFSLSIGHSVETGRDAFHDGTASGNNSHLLLVALGTAVDALLAVEDVVYKERLMTLQEFGKVMKRNWKGHEELRLKMLRSKRKWGKNVPDANALGREIARRFAKETNNLPNSRGGRFVSGGHSSRRFIDFGNKTGATPDGRKAGEELSKNLSPAVESDSEGVTALINTIASIDPSDMPMDLPLDVMLHPSAVEGEKGLQVMRAITEVYHSKGLTLIQYNVFDAEMLRDAQKNPHKYGHLQVRVCGWNIRWNDLPKAQQDAYIRRAENILR